MRLHNLKDAGSLMPQWATACLLNVAFLALYTIAVYRLDAKPSSYVASACTAAILLSLVLALGLLVRDIMFAKPGEVADAVSKGAVAGLNLSWAITCVSFLSYIGWAPLSDFAAGNVNLVLTGIGAALMMGVGYFIATPSSKTTHKEAQSSHALALVPGLKPTFAQQPTFQVTMADLTRLISHQAGRAIGYSGSKVLFDDSFSLELDVNERVARVYSNTNLIHSEEFMFWRLHMLMMGSASESLLIGNSSQAAMDDLTSFDELASRYLTLRIDRTFNATPINMYEAQIKASRIAMLRKSIYDRCHAACVDNQQTLTELVKLMRTRNVLTYGDIRAYLERVKMPEGFPVACFDDNEILRKARLAYDDHQEVKMVGSDLDATGLDQLEPFDEALAQQIDAEQASNQPLSEVGHTAEPQRRPLSNVHKLIA
jgi:hypothetical protein